MERQTKQVSGIDWVACGNHLFINLPRVLSQQAEFLRENPRCAGSWRIGTYPPRITLYFWFPEPPRCRRKVSAVDVGTISSPTENSDGPTLRSILRDLRPEEINLVADFVGSVASPLVARRERDPGGDNGLLEYKLVAKYDDFKK